MRPLTTIELLDVWEKGTTMSPIERSLHLLEIACSPTDINSIANLSIGQRDIRLLQLREWMFGTNMKNTANCPKCAEQVEWQNNVQDLRLQQLRYENSPNKFELTIEDFHICFRLPTSHDFIIATEKSLAEDHPDHLLNECLLDVKKNGENFNKKQVPITVIEAVNKQMQEEDPQADISMLLTCPSCAHQWQSVFDIVSYLLAEINSWAKHILRDVCLLASSFGWSEYDILRMNPARRKLYLEMLLS